MNKIEVKGLLLQWPVNLIFSWGHLFCFLIVLNIMEYPHSEVSDSLRVSFSLFLLLYGGVPIVGAVFCSP